MAFNKPSEAVIEQLKAAVPGRCLTGADIIDDYTHDEMDYSGKGQPDAVCLCTSTEEVSAVCRICYDNDLVIVPRGAGTGLSGGCTPFYGGVVVDTSKMNKILAIDKDNMIARIESGVLLTDLANAAVENGMMYPPDPGEIYATVGGNVACNAGGMRAVKYGCTREYVRTMTVVLPDGRIVKLGGETSKNSSGYSLLSLMIGSEGTLGIITELGLKLIPAPKYQVSLLGVFEDLSSCIHTVSKVKLSGYDPQALEFIPRKLLDLIEKYMGKAVYPHEIEGTEVGAYLLTTFDCRKEEEFDEIMEGVAEVMLEAGALDIVVFDTPDAMRNAWAVRKAALEAMQAAYNQMDECDIVVPVSNIATFCEYLMSIEDEVGMTLIATGHAGDGNLHCNCLANDMDPAEFRKKADKFLDLAFAKGKELNALVSGEHGIGSIRRRYLEESCGKDVMELMRGIKSVFDPKGLLNPGKVCTYVDGE